MNSRKNIVMRESGFGGDRAKGSYPTERNKVRILLCDNNAESCREIFSLLSQCSYQVTSVWSDREIVDALDSNGPHSDIILAEVTLLMADGAQMLRYIMHHKQLQHIPVIILSRRDQVSITIKGLRLGAADYLLKPLQVQELSELWMHMQKRIKIQNGVSSMLQFLHLDRRNEAIEGCCSRIKDINI